MEEKQDIHALGFYIRKANILLDRNLSLIIAKNNAHGGTQGMVLKYLSKSKGDVYQKDIEESFGVRRSTMSEMLDSLEKSGFIIRQTSLEDKRKNKIILTNKGIKECDLMQNSIDEFEKNMQKGILEKEIEEFLKTLSKVLTNLKEMEEENKWTK